MKLKSTIILVFIVIVLILIILNTLLINKIFYNKETINQNAQASNATEIYNPQINPNDFVSKIDNKYFTLTPSTKFIYSEKTEEGTERTEVYVTYDTKKVMGINAVVVWDRVWLNDELIEETYDWYAQDKYGNVWYFGEDSKELVNGKVASTKGSWEAGVNGAKPGIIMKANPQVGDSYRQEYLKGEAEDMADVVSLGVKIKVVYGSFSNCLQTKDWTPLEPAAAEYKYYCPEVGNVIYEVGIESVEGTQLISIGKESEKKQLAKIEEGLVKELKKAITEEEAIVIAQKAVKGKVTDVGIDKKFGKAVYVVEIDADGKETDIIIDIETGEVLGIET